MFIYASKNLYLMRVLMNNRSLFKRRTYRRRWGLVVVLLALNGLFLNTSNAGEDIPPELSSDATEDKFAHGKRFMAVTANPLATEAAYKILIKAERYLLLTK